MEKKEFSPISVKRTQELLYGMLLQFAKYCDENGLRYFLFGGTLLGAIRHNDFIPWDDDIDISMPRPDYIRLVELEQVNKIGNLELIKGIHPFLKLVNRRVECVDSHVKTRFLTGLFIDIFPIDGVPENQYLNKHFHRILRNKIKLDKYIVDQRDYHHGVVRYLYGELQYYLNLFIPGEKYGRIIEQEAMLYPYDKCKYVSVCVWGWGIHDISLKEELEKRVKFKFRDSEFWCQGDYIKSLSQKYGDFWELPPVEKRQGSHGTFLEH